MWFLVQVVNMAVVAPVQVHPLGLGTNVALKTDYLITVRELNLLIEHELREQPIFMMQVIISP
jgi:hypothetical protein